jgi:hypothetical protein
MVMLTDGVKAKDKEEEVKVFDIAELVQQCCMPETKKTAEEAKAPPTPAEPPKSESANPTT